MRQPRPVDGRPKTIRRTLVLFGPPGIGKSTIIAELDRRGWRAYDCEWKWGRVWSHIGTRGLSVKMARELLSGYDVVGAAGIRPDAQVWVHGGKHFIRVLLMMDEEAYQARRAQRDRLRPDKADQAAQTMADWDRSMFDEVVSASTDSVAALAGKWGFTKRRGES